MANGKPHEEWLRQAKYDYTTAKAMFATRRYIYAVFMCHLAVEKTLKGMLVRKSRQGAPRTHDLLFLLGKLDVSLSPEQQAFMEELNAVSVQIRYPEQLAELQRAYHRRRVAVIMAGAGKVMKWLGRK